MKETKIAPTSEGYWWVKTAANMEPEIYQVILPFPYKTAPFDFSRAVLLDSTGTRFSGSQFLEGYPTALYQKVGKWKE